MARYLFCVLLLPIFMASAHEFSSCGPGQNALDASSEFPTLYHQTPAIISQLKQFDDEVKLITIELEGLIEQLRIDKNSTAITEDIKVKRKRLSYLNNKMSDAEESLRVIYRHLSKQISAIRYCTADRMKQEEYYRSIEAYFMIPEYKRLYVDHNDYERYFFKLNVGYEYNSISGILKESSPRIGLLIYSHFGRMPHQVEYGLGEYGYQLFANLILSGNTDSQISSTVVAEDEQIENSLGINISVYKPLLRSKIRPDVSHLFGPVISINSKQNDETTEIQNQYYAGVRSAMSPEHYIDVLYGRSPGQVSKRLEIRGQMPVATMGGGSRFYIGVLANIGVANKQENENDVFTVYVSWNIDFLDLFATGG